MVVVIADYIPVGALKTTALTASETELTVETDADGVLLQAIAQDIYFTIDGTTPEISTPKGFLLGAYDPPIRVPYDPDYTVITVLRATDGAILQQQDVKTNA